MGQKKDILKKSRHNLEEKINANELLQESLDDVIASLIDLNEDDISEDSSTGQTHIDKGLQNVESFDLEMERPIVLTERAAWQVQKILEQEGMKPGLYLRVAVEGGGCSGLSYKLGLDYLSDDDQMYNSFGVQIIVKKEHLIYLEGITIDYPEGLDARGFVFDNPNATDNCGCGESFSV